MVTSLVHSGNSEKAVEYLKKISGDQFAGQEDQEFVAWNFMLLGRVDQDILTKLRKWSETNTKLDSDYWYSLGMLQAFVGKPDEAQRSLTAALDRDDTATLDARPWALAGKIYDSYGDTDAAAVAYDKARSVPREDEMAVWALSLVLQKSSGHVIISLVP
jgi:tetratricopeptide (TPR) repeat protein